MTQTAIRPRRSVLFMPGSNRRAHEKARGLPVDAVIIDLEDSIAPEAKAEARQIACESVRAGGFGYREVAIRINGFDTAWADDDLSAAIEARPDAIVLTKVNGPAELARVGAAIRMAGADPIEVWAMIETPRALLDIRDIAAFEDADGPLATLVLGTNDIAKELRLGAAPGRPGMVGHLANCVLVARAHGLDILDGVFNDFSDTVGLRAECRQGRALGMDGKTLIHPSQVATANELFAPSQQEQAAARRILAAFERPENAGRGAISLDGRMVEALHAEMARRTVALADAIAAREVDGKSG